MSSPVAQLINANNVLTKYINNELSKMESELLLFNIGDNNVINVNGSSQGQDESDDELLFKNYLNSTKEKIINKRKSGTVTDSEPNILKNRVNTFDLNINDISDTVSEEKTMLKQMMIRSCRNNQIKNTNIKSNINYKTKSELSNDSDDDSEDELLFKNFFLQRKNNNMCKLRASRKTKKRKR